MGDHWQRLDGGSGAVHHLHPWGLAVGTPSRPLFGKGMDYRCWLPINCVGEKLGKLGTGKLGVGIGSRGRGQG